MQKYFYVLRNTSSSGEETEAGYTTGNEFQGCYQLKAMPKRQKLCQMRKLIKNVLCLSLQVGIMYLNVSYIYHQYSGHREKYMHKIYKKILKSAKPAAILLLLRFTNTFMGKKVSLTFSYTKPPCTYHPHSTQKNILCDLRRNKKNVTLIIISIETLLFRIYLSITF